MFCNSHGTVLCSSCTRHRSALNARVSRNRRRLESESSLAVTDSASTTKYSVLSRNEMKKRLKCMHEVSSKEKESIAIQTKYSIGKGRCSAK